MCGDQNHDLDFVEEARLVHHVEDDFMIFPTEPYTLNPTYLLPPQP